MSSPTFINLPLPVYSRKGEVNWCCGNRFQETWKPWIDHEGYRVADWLKAKVAVVFVLGCTAKARDSNSTYTIERWIGRYSTCHPVGNRAKSVVLTRPHRVMGFSAEENWQPYLPWFDYGNSGSNDASWSLRFQACIPGIDLSEAHTWSGTQMLPGFSPGVDANDCVDISQGLQKYISNTKGQCSCWIAYYSSVQDMVSNQRD
jgi:hypothetical protein